MATSAARASDFRSAPIRRFVKTLCLIVLLAIAAPASAARATASATIVVPASVAAAPSSATAMVSVSIEAAGQYAHVTVAFN
jgi:hypothetical protein